MPLVALMLPIVVVMACLWLLAANETSKSWLEPLIASLKTNRGGFFTRILTLPTQLLVRAGASAFSAVAHSISVAATHYMGAGVHWLNAHTLRLRMGRVQAQRFADDVAHGFERTTGHVIPREVGKRTRPIDRRAKRAGKIAVGAALLGANLAKRFAHVIGREVRPQLHHLHHATTVTLPREIGRIRTREKAIETQLRKPSRQWLRRIAAAMWGAYLLGALLKVLARRFPWLFCRKVRTVGSRLCAIDQDLLNSLLADTLLIAGAISVVSFAQEVKGFMGVAEPAIKAFVRETSGLSPQDYLS